jgi:hypothetical protein
MEQPAVDGGSDTSAGPAGPDATAQPTGDGGSDTSAGPTGPDAAKQPTPDAAKQPPGNDLPLLPPGNHAGMIVGFNPALPIATAAAVDLRWRQAVAAGMKVGRVQMDWGEIESSPESYKLGDLDDTLSDVSRDGVKPFILLDSFDGDIPPDLRKRLDAGEIGWDHPTVIARHAAMLRRVMPTLQRHGVWIIAIANEIGNLLDDLEPVRRAELTRQLLALFSASRTEVHRLAPGMAVTVTVREQQEPDIGDTEAPFVKWSEVASFNFYCGRFSNDLAVATDPATIRGYIDGMLERAGTKSVVIQELGCHAGYDNKPSPTGATAAQQAKFYEVVLGELAARPRLRAAIVFQLVDWAATLVESSHSAPFRAEGLPAAFIAQFAESLETVGFLRFRDGTARPAWTTFLSHL